MRVNLAAEIRLQMESQHINQAEVAEMCGITQSAVSQILSGGRRPNIDTFCRICDGFGLTPNDMLGYSSNSKSVLASRAASLRAKIELIKSLVSEELEAI
jgi:transcriptional regulator with XRE-family HTH domain